MPQIPGLPTVDPVAEPQANPRQFGSVGQAIAGLGEETEELAAEASSVAGRLIVANRQLKAKQSEIAIDRYMNQVYDDLGKATTVEGVDDVVRNAQAPDKVGPLVEPYESDRRLAQMVHLAWQQSQAALEHSANVQKAHIITEGTKAADAVNEAKTGSQAVSVAMAGGDDDTVKVFRDRYEMGLAEGARAGVYTPEQIKAKMYAWDQGFMESLAKAGMDSPDQAIRKRTIADLKAGGGHFAGLDQTTRNALYDSALKRDTELTNLSEAADLDASTAHFNQLTKGWTYESKIDATGNDDWAKANGFIDANGNPNRRILDKIGEDVDRQEVRTRKVQTEKDNDIIEKHLTDIDGGKLSDIDIDKVVLKEGGSPHAASQMKAARRDILRQELELGSLSMQQRAMKRQEWQDQSLDQLGRIQADIQRGVRHSDEEIYGMVGRGQGKLSAQQASEAVRMSHSYETDPTNKPFYNTIWNQQFANPAMAGEAISELDKYIREHPNASSIEKSKAVKEILEPKNIDRVNKALDAAGDVFNTPKGQAQSPNTPAPPRPKAVPSDALWNPSTRTWQLPQQ